MSCWAAVGFPKSLRAAAFTALPSSAGMVWGFQILASGDAWGSFSLVFNFHMGALGGPELGPDLLKFEKELRVRIWVPGLRPGPQGRVVGTCESRGASGRTCSGHRQGGLE